VREQIVIKTMEIPTYSIFEFNPHSWMVGKNEWIPNFTLLPLNEPRKVTVYWPEGQKDKSGRKSVKPYIAKLVISKGM
jgi:hypothetical protein